MSDEDAEEPLQPQLAAGDIVAQKYAIESLLGVGGMGTVYAAKHLLSGRRVALKWVDPDSANAPHLLERFVREAQAMGRIEHPNVVGVLDAGVEANAAYLTMELLRGESLRDLIDREAPFSAEAALALMMPALEGVEAAHRVEVIHRDLKPDNLFVVRRSSSNKVLTTKVLDFGISKLEQPKGSLHVTQAGSLIGTPHYMSPEQGRGLAVDIRSDTWSLGVILYELLAGAPPFDADTLVDLLVAVTNEEPLSLAMLRPDLPAGLCDVVARALNKDPDERWQTVREFAMALEPYSADARFKDPVLSVRPPPNASEPAPTSPGDALTMLAKPSAKRSAEPPPKHHRGSVAAGIGVVALIAVLAMALRAEPAETPPAEPAAPQEPEPPRLAEPVPAPVASPAPEPEPVEPRLSEKIAEPQPAPTPNMRPSIMAMQPSRVAPQSSRAPRASKMPPSRRSRVRGPRSGSLSRDEF